MNREQEDNLLAELKEDFLKDEDRPGAAQDGEGLTGKNRVGYSCHRRPEQWLNRTLGTQGEKSSGWATMSLLSVTQSPWGTEPFANVLTMTMHSRWRLTSGICFRIKKKIIPNKMFIAII